MKNLLLFGAALGHRKYRFQILTALRIRTSYRERDIFLYL